MERAYIPGLMAENMRDNGAKIGCMEKAHLFGQMVENILAIILTIENQAMVSSNGQIVAVTEVNGLKVNNMEKVLISQAKAKKSMANGKMEDESDG